MRDRLGVDRDSFDAGLKHASLNVIESPLRQARDAFDRLPTSTVADWHTISTTLAAIPTALAGYQESRTLARKNGRIAARLQIEKVIEQARALAAPGSSFDRLVADATEVPAA